MTKSLRYLLMTLPILIMAGCSRKDGSDTANLPGNAITGLGSPVRLQLRNTKVILEDYFPDPKGITSVSLDGKALTPDSSFVVSIDSNLINPLGNLSVVYQDLTYDIPVFASEKTIHHFTYRSPNAPSEVGMAGNMNGWNYKSTLLKKEGDVWSTDIELNPGVYQYRIWEDGREKTDINNQNKISNGMGGFNNTFYAGKAKGQAPLLLTSNYSDTLIELRSSIEPSDVFAYFENHRITTRTSGNSVLIPVPASATSLQRSHLRIWVHDGTQRSNDILIPLHQGRVIENSTELNRNDLHASVMYFMMVDRFNDGNASNNRPTNDANILPKANNMGGDLKGITKKIEDGYFSGLGINTLWISPISQNAEGAWGLWDKGVTSTFSAYHGYWPISLRSVDNRFGTKDELKELLATAHKNGMNVILDYVAHHVHENHPLYKMKPEWTTPLFLPDGTMNTEKWDEHRLTTWFDTFMPTWDFSKPEVVDALSDTALYWITEYDLDGFRHDATKHVREEFWRALTKKAKTALAENPERKLFQIGETYGNPELIASYISTGQMDAQFDFNLYDAEVDAFAKAESGFSTLGWVLSQSMHYYGSHHLMGNITGNQDRARFISYADGSVGFDEDAKLAGWTRTITNRNEEGFQRMKMLNAFLMTTPGIPCIYYGDEIGMPGGNDPDNRRMMIFSDWNQSQKSLQEEVSKLIHFRRSSMPLIYGDLVLLKGDEEGFAYARHYFGKTVVVAFTKRPGASTLVVNLPDWIRPSELNESLLGHSTSVNGNQISISFSGPGAAVVH